MKVGKGFFITGTDTGVGKTFVAAGIAGALKRRGVAVGVMKPVQTGFAGSEGALVGDAGVLARAAQVNDEPALINPYCFREPLAPLTAAEMAGVTIDPEKISKAYQELARRYAMVLVEGAGGLLAPLARRLLIADLVKMMELPLIVVTRSTLGTVNHTLLTVSCAKSLGIPLAGIIVNNFQEDVTDKSSVDLITTLSSVPVLGVIPHSADLHLENIINLAEKFIAWDRLDLEAVLPSRKDSPLKDRLKELEEKDKKYVWYPFTQMKDYLSSSPVIIERGQGPFLIDITGKKYYDGVSSLWLNVHGHRRPEIDQAICRQLNKIAHSTMLGLTHVPAIELAERLVSLAPPGLTKVFYSDNGSTAVEVALKMAFQYWQHKGEKSKTRFLTLTNAYHGDTIGAVSVGGIDLFHKIFHPLLFQSIKAPSPYCYRCSLDLSPARCALACAAAVEEILQKHHRELAAMIVEPKVQGAGGMLVQPPGYLRRIRDLCAQYNVLFIADEVATGFGKTGKMFACEHEGVSPDLMAVSKGISGGYLPLAATLTTDEIYNAFCAAYREQKTFYHGHSYTGNPLACAAALANLELFDKEKILEQLPSKIALIGEKLRAFAELPEVGDIRQCGVMVGIELVQDKNTKKPFPIEEKRAIRACLAARKKGMIIRPLGDVVVFMPPLGCPTEDLENMLAILYASIAESRSREVTREAD